MKLFHHPKAKQTSNICKTVPLPFHSLGIHLKWKGVQVKKRMMNKWKQFGSFSALSKNIIVKWAEIFQSAWKIENKNLVVSQLTTRNGWMFFAHKKKNWWKFSFELFLLPFFKNEVFFVGTARFWVDEAKKN